MMMHDDACDVDMTKKRQRARNWARHAVPLRWVGTRMSAGICRRGEAGLTLIELIVVMIVISVAMVGVMSVINYTTRHSADPVLRHQAIAIAEAYMEEIVLKEFCEPDQTPAECAANPCPDSEANRDLYDNVCDYDGLVDNGAHNQNDQLIPGLENYRVNVSVVQEAFGPSGNTVAGLRIDVAVTDPSGQSLRLSSYRADY